MELELVDINDLKPLERVFPNQLRNISKLIELDGEIKKALIIDKKTGVVLEGSHRYAFLFSKGYLYAPVYKVDYENENIRVGTKLSHRFLVDEDVQVSKSECLSRGLQGNLLFPRTTKHFFPFKRCDISISLKALELSKPRDISHLIQDISTTEEILSNKDYINEIDDEITIISQYIADIVESKNYLIKQIDMLERSQPVAFFPGKFHPPHMGHVRTILNLAPSYKKFIVGVTSDTPDDQVVTQSEIADLLRDVLGNIQNIEVVTIEGTLTKKKNTKGLPKFDILLSGNPKVVDWANKHNLENRFVDRSFAEGCSGENIRRFLNQSNSDN